MASRSVWTKLLALFLLAALRLTAAGAFEVPASAAREFQSAVEDLQAGRYDHALKTLAELDKRIPGNPEILHLSAILFDLTGRPEEANSYFERAAKSAPDSALIRTNLGVSLMRLGNPERAEREFRQALQLEPQNAGAAFNLGTLLMARREFEQAEAWLAKAFQLQPQVYENGYQLAFCSFLLDHNQAVDRVLLAVADEGARRPEFRLLKALNDQALDRPAQLSEALESVRPALTGHPETNRQVVTLLLKLGLQRESIPLLEQLVRDEPDSARDWLLLGQASLSSGETKRAIEAGERALALQPGAPAHVLLGDAYEAAQQPLQAIEQYQRAADLDPSEENLYALGYEFLSHWNWDAATAVFKRGLELHPGSWRMLIGSGAAELARDDPERATLDFVAAIDSAPDEPLGYRLLAQAFGRAGDAFEPAFDRFARLHKKKPADPWATYFWTLAIFEKASRPGTLGWSELEGALSELQTVADAHPETFEFQALVGESLFLMQRWEGAANALRKATLANPNDVQVRYKLGLTLRRLGRTEEASQQLKAYQQLKSKQDSEVNKRMSETTKFIVDLKTP